MEHLLPFLVHVMGARDPYAQSHGDNVAKMATDLAQKIDLDADRIRVLDFAANIHDLGKIAINETILNKPGRFTEAEYIMVQHHTVLGAKLVESLDLDPRIQQTILHHHENFDGTGYPGGLKGDQIQLEARILRIVDSYDALTHRRIYRNAHTPREAVYIMEEEHSNFDQTILDIFFKSLQHLL